jgi:RNase P protein component
VVTRSADPSFTIGVTVYDRRITAVQRNLIRRRMSEAFTRERRRFAEAVQSSGVRVEAILGYRVRAGAGERSTPFAELHADIAHVLEGIISRIRQQWPQQ